MGASGGERHVQVLILRRASILQDQKRVQRLEAVRFEPDALTARPMHFTLERLAGNDHAVSAQHWQRKAKPVLEGGLTAMSSASKAPHEFYLNQ